MNKLVELRKSIGISQVEASKILNISRRSYQSYEEDTEKEKTKKYSKYQEILEEYYNNYKANKVLTVEEISKLLKDICIKYNIDFMYVYGNVVRGIALHNSEINLLYKGHVNGLDYYSLYREISKKLNKDITLNNASEVNSSLLIEVLEEGRKIY